MHIGPSGSEEEKEQCSVDPLKPYCGNADKDGKKACFECLENEHCGTKCKSFTACEGTACSLCDYYFGGRCKNETGSEGEMIRSCVYDMVRDKKGENQNANWCIVGKCKDEEVNLVPHARCLVTEDDCGETCYEKNVHKLQVNNIGTECQIDETKLVEPCEGEPCTSYMAAGGVQKAFCGCDDIGKDLTLGGENFGQYMPSNYLCISDRTFGNFVESGNLDKLLDQAADICDTCEIQDLNLHFMGHGSPGSQGFVYPNDVFTEIRGSLNSENCNDHDVKDQLQKLNGCVKTVTLNGCNVGSGPEGLALRKCLSENIGIDVDKVVAFTGENQIEPATGQICPISPYNQVAPVEGDIFSEFDTGNKPYQMDALKNWIDGKS